MGKAAGVGVVACDAHLVTRLVAILSAAGWKIAHTAADMSQLDRDDWGTPVVVVVACPAANPVPTLREAIECFEHSRIVGVTPAATLHTVRRCVRAGAAGLVLEDRLEGALEVAVLGAWAGQLTVPLELADGLARPMLTSREKQVLGMVVMGFTNGEIARRLFLAESTVKSHLSSIFGKLGVRSRTEAAALVLDPDGGLGTGILAIADDGAAAYAFSSGSAA